MALPMVSYVYIVVLGFLIFDITCDHMKWAQLVL